MRIDLCSLHEGRSVRYSEIFQSEEAEALLGATLAQPITIVYDGVMVDGVLYLRITTQGKVYGRCDLCGTPTTADATCTLDEELVPDGPYFDNETQSFDLTELGRQAVVLSAPRHMLCKANCKGLCPVCGHNRNLGDCQCVIPSNIGENNPFSVLQDLISTGGANNGSTKM